jgi:plasmid stability protein
MPTLTITKVPEAVHRALRARAARNARSLEAELREILAEAARVQARLGLGSTLAAAARRRRIKEADLGVLERQRDAARAARFE